MILVDVGGNASSQTHGFQNLAEGMTVHAGSRLIVDDLQSFGGRGIICEGDITLVGNVGIFNTLASSGLPGDAVAVKNGGRLRITGDLYGIGNAGVGMRIFSGHVPQYTTGHVPTVTGTGGNIVIANASAVLWATLPISISATAGAGFIAIA